MPALIPRCAADFLRRAIRGRPAGRAARPLRWAARLLHLDGALHIRMQTADVFVDACRGERLRVTLTLEEHGGALLALRECDLMRRVVGVGPRHVLAGSNRQLGRSECESGDADVIGAGLRRHGAPRRLAGEPDQGDHEVLLRVRLVALEARLVVRLVVELLIGRESRVLPLAVADVVRVLRAPARPLLHDGEAGQVALHEPTVSILDRVAEASTCALYWIKVRTVPLGIGLPSRAALTASGVL